MFKLRLRTKFLLSLLLVSSSVTCATLWIVGRSLRTQLQAQLAEDLNNSVNVFRDFQRQREISLSQSAQLLANLPSLKAVMTTRDAATIQDASTDFWKLARNDLFLLADPSGRVEAVRTTSSGMTPDLAQTLLSSALREQQPSYWWYGRGKLYQVFLQPIYFGGVNDGSLLGVLGLGYEISEDVARDLSQVVASDIAFFYGNRLIVSTLSGSLAHVSDFVPTPKELRVGRETFLAQTVEITPSVAPFVHLTVFKSYDKAAAFLQRLNGLLIVVGILSILAGSALVFLISHAFTKPLANLVDGVRALGSGDFAYPLTTSGSDEIAEVTDAFDRMRYNLRQMQHELLRSERLATIGQMATFVSHDLRHPLTAVLGNAEFLCESNLSPTQREELYWEIRRAVERMTELIESLLEFSHSRESLQTAFNDLREAAETAVGMVKSRPEFQRIPISVSCEGCPETLFDRRKIERVLVNVLLNACEFVSPESGLVRIDIVEMRDLIEIWIEDNGPGIADEIRGKLFQPFVSYGKQNGIGLGLTIAKKVLQDHGGDICLEMSGPGRTIFRLTLPKEVWDEKSLESHNSHISNAGLLAGDRTEHPERIFPAAS